MARLTSTAANGILLLLSVATWALTGCAASYTSIQPLNVAYYYEWPVEGDTAVTIGYRYDVLTHSNNRRYAQLESKTDFILLGFRINNYGDDTLYFPENFIIHDDSFLIEPLFASEAYLYLKQIDNDNRIIEVETISLNPIELLVQIPFLANETVAGLADQKMYREFETYDLMGSVIMPHSAVQGLLALPVTKRSNLKFKKRYYQPGKGSQTLIYPMDRSDRWP